MLKLFGNKKKKSSTGGLKLGDLKIPIPMINGAQYADMTESQISTLIGGGNKGEIIVKKKPVSSISSQRTNNTTNTDKTPAVTNHPIIVPSRSISSPPVLVMPKPVYSLPPTRFIFRSHEYEKTQVESSEDDEDSLSSDEELLPSNNNTGTVVDQTINKDYQALLIGKPPITIIEEGKEKKSSPVVVAVTLNEKKAPAIVESPKKRNNTYDSIRQYISSASESPFFSTSVSNMNNNNILLSDQVTFSSSPFLVSPTTTTSTQEKNRSSLLRISIDTPPPPLNNHHRAFAVSARSFESEIITSVMEPTDNNENSLSHEIVEAPTVTTPRNIKEATAPLSNNITGDSTQDFIIENTATSQQNNKIEKTSLRINSSSSISKATTTRVTRPTSSATIEFDVTHTSLNKFKNNSDNPPGNQFRSIQNNNNNNNKYSMEILDTQNKMEKMILSEDLEELKRTVDRMQQQRVSDREEHLKRVKEQRLREKEILNQINLTKQRLEMAIAGNFFMEDLHNTNDTDINSLNALQQANELEILQQQQQKKGNSIEEEYMIQPHPTLKPSISASSARSRLKANSSEVLRQLNITTQQENDRPRNNKKPVPSTPDMRQQNQHQQQDPCLTSESYFPDVDEIDFKYMGKVHGSPPPPQLHQFFPPIPNKFRNSNGNMSNYYANMDFMDNRYDAFDSPRICHGMRPQRSKSVESQWLEQDFTEQQQQQQQQQFRHPTPRSQQQQQRDYGYDLVDPIDGYRIASSTNNGRTRSRKSSTHSSRSNLSDGAPVSRSIAASNQSSGYHSAAEKEGHANVEDGAEEDFDNRHGKHILLPGNSSRHNSDGEQQRPQFQYDDPTMHHSSRSNSGRYRQRPPPNNGMGGHMPHSMMYFGPPPHMSHMGMMNDRERIKMRQSPYGYNNMPLPNGSDYYPYIPPQSIITKNDNCIYRGPTMEWTSSHSPYSRPSK